ncbi:C-type lectin domain family 17, member A-like [Ostrea edulis]|uniref:C-type lectin domain family 17, member A-like n=1 Tax=Ostrea edulis TaxID=37623 RepID=UPI0024AEE958|nr:C-type lectin domain family 17, member A-like [Ostrea edulis]
MESEMNDKVSNASLVGEYHSDSPIMCSGFGQFNYLAFNAKEKKCRVHTCYPAGCGYEWLEYNGHCYFFGATELTWTEARMACGDRSSQLVELEDIEESTWLASTFLYKDTCPTFIYYGCSAWTGGNDIWAEGDYRWHHSNLSMEFKNWNPDQPSVHHDNEEEDCIAILRNGKWNDQGCNERNSFICEKKKC